MEYERGREKQRWREKEKQSESAEVHERKRERGRDEKLNASSYLQLLTTLKPFHNFLFLSELGYIQSMCVHLSERTAYMQLLWVSHRAREAVREWVSAGKIERLIERPAWWGGGGEQPEQADTQAHMLWS